MYLVYFNFFLKLFFTRWLEEALVEEWRNSFSKNTDFSHLRWNERLQHYYLNIGSVFFEIISSFNNKDLLRAVVWNDFKNCTCEAKSMTYRYIVFTILVHYTIYLAPFQSFTSKFFKHTVIVSWWGANVYALVTILLP